MKANTNEADARAKKARQFCGTKEATHIAMVSAKINPGDYGTHYLEWQDFERDVSAPIWRRWHPPNGIEQYVVLVGFTIEPDGQISDIHLTRSSNIEIADDAALSSVQNLKFHVPSFVQKNVPATIQFWASKHPTKIKPG